MFGDPRWNVLKGNKCGCQEKTIEVRGIGGIGQNGGEEPRTEMIETRKTLG